jgi:hypothetical protein
VGLVVALAVIPSRAELAVHVWLLVLLSLAVLTALGVLRRSYPDRPSVFESSPSERVAPRRFTSLARVEREVALGSASAHDTHFRLRPTLRGVAGELLAARRGVVLDRSPDRARDLLGEEAWELVRADREAPADPRAPGLDRGTIERVLSSLERL